MTVQAVDFRPSTDHQPDEAQLEALVRGAAAHNARLRALRDLLTERRRLDEELLALGVNVARVSELIIAELALLRGVSAEELKGDGRSRPVAHARQELMWRLRDVRLSDGSRRWSLPQIGQMLGGRDHTTVLHGLRAYAARHGVEYQP